MKDRSPPDEDRSPLVLDELRERLDRLRVITGDDAATDVILGELGGSGRVERDMVRELAATRPVAYPDRLAEAHTVAMRAVEVLARNGARPPSQLQAWVLTPVARFFVQHVIRYIVREHQGRVIEAIRDLYTRRIGWTPVGDPSRVVLLRGRRDAERTVLSYKQRAAGIPTFLLGGAAVSSVAQAVRRGVATAAGSRAGVVVATFATFVLLAAVSWVILHGAAVARRRIRVALEAPLAALWETIGWCGRPPRDTARNFAAVAITLTVVGWLLLPLAAVFVFTVL